MEKAQKLGNWRPFLNLIRQTNPPKLLLGTAISMSVITTLVALVIPLFTKNLVDGFSLASISRTQVILLAVTFIAQALTAGISIYLLSRVGQGIVAGLRDRLWKKLLF